VVASLLEEILTDRGLATLELPGPVLRSRATGWTFRASEFGFSERILDLSMVSRKPENVELFITTDSTAGTAHYFWEEGAKSWRGEYFWDSLQGPPGRDHPTGR
jgi:hypothetical protein